MLHFAVKELNTNVSDNFLNEIIRTAVFAKFKYKHDYVYVKKNDKNQQT